MKGTEQFTEIIKVHLREICKRDAVFLQKCRNPSKSIDECIQYILGEVVASGCNGFADDEIFSMAVHYFDENDIQVKKCGEGRVVVNHHIELTEEEKAKARKQAIEQYQAKIIQDLHKPKTTTKSTETAQQATLFNF